MKTLPIALVLLALPALGCSKASDPIAKGNMRFNVGFTDNPSETGGCGQTGNGGVGDPPPDLPNPDFSVNGLGAEVVDGQSIQGSNESYLVECTVKSSGKLSVKIEGPNYQGVASDLELGEASIQVSGTIDTSSGEGSGNVAVRNVQTGATPNDVACELHALPDDEGNPAVGAGRAAFTFECARATSAYDEFGACKTRGTVIVRDCLEE